MMDQRRAFIPSVVLAALITFAVGCKDARINTPPPEQPIEVSRLETVDYDTTHAQVRLEGKFIKSGASPLDTLQFFDGPGCASNPLGTKLVQDFDNNGIDLNIELDRSYTIYVSTENSSQCLLFKEFSTEGLAPQPPQFVRTSPESPTRDTFSPGIFGSAFPKTSTLNFYRDSGCSDLAGTGSNDDYGTIGIPITLLENQMTEVYATATDVRNQVSACTKLTEYTHSNTVIAAPTFISSSVPSPTNLTASPIIKGNVAPESVVVTLYSDANCSLQLVSGDPNDFLNDGFAATIPENATTNIYAKSVDSVGNPSVCALLIQFTHDTIAPADPTYVDVTPVTPTNQTLFPVIQGASSADTFLVKLYNDMTCDTEIGSGTKATFDGSGFTASITPNTTTSIYAASLDQAGNKSACTLMVNYTHNTVAPNPPIFSGTDPTSPNNSSTTPKFFGTTEPRTIQLDLYDDENCTNQVGSGDTATFEGGGIQVTASANTTTSIYSRVRDFEGNYSMCTFLGDFSHSNQPAPDPSFLFSFPASPSKNSVNPFIVGTADTSIQTITIYDNVGCTNSIGSGTRGNFVSSGIQVTVPPNATTTVYTRAVDVFGNDSNCTLLTTYIHNTIPPFDPTFTASVPVTPSNSSTSPLIQGSALTNPASQLPPDKVAFYNSAGCVSKIGEGTPAEFSGAGILVNVGENAVTTIYAKSIDEATNSSNCTYLFDYIHDNYQPGKPIFLSSSPFSPSYTQDVKFQGTFGSSPDFMNKVSVGIYTDSGCSSLLISGSPTDWEGTGIDVQVPANATTQLYGATVNDVGTFSDCEPIANFQHSDISPQSLAVSSNFDGSNYLSWLPDSVASPTPSYTIERSHKTGGPYTIVGSGGFGNNFTDTYIVDGETYFYRVYATNNTGRSQYSSEVSITVSAPPAIPVGVLNAIPGDASVSLTWGGFAQDMTYKVLRAQQPGGPYSQVQDGETTLSQFLDETVSNDTAYYYVIVASNPSGDTVQSNEAAVVPKVTPPAPTDFNMAIAKSIPECSGAAGVYFTWKSPSYLDSFQVQEGTGVSPNVITSTNNTSYIQCDFFSGNTNSYSVSSRWNADLSAKSNRQRHYNTSGTSLTVWPGDGENVLNWSLSTIPPYANNPVGEFDIYRATHIEGPYSKIQDGITTYSYTDTAVSNGTHYFYYVQARVVNNSGARVYVGWPSDKVGGIPKADPVAPIDLQLNINSADQVRLDWNSQSYYNHFNIYHSNALGGPYTKTTTTPSNTFNGAFASVGMNYYYVTANWGGSETAATNIVSYRHAPISGLVALPTPTQINLNWDDVTGVQDYRVLRSTSLNGTYTQIGAPTNSEFDDTTAVSGQGYYYKVVADFADLTSGLESAAVTAMRTDSTTPSGVSGYAMNTTSIFVKWPYVSGATTYKTFVATAPGGPWTLKATGPSTQAILTTLLARTEYYIKVEATVATLPYESTPITITTLEAPLVPVVSAGTGEVNVSWSATIGALSYDLLRSTNGSSFTPVVTSHPTTSFADTTVSNGTNYFYKLQANFTVGSTQSDPSIGVTPGVTPEAPVGLTAKNAATNDVIELSWPKVDGITKYNLYKATSPGGPYGLPTQSSSATQNVQVVGLTAGTTYYFVITSVIGDIESGFSNEVSHVPELSTAAPTVTKNSATQIDISWGAVSGASTYDLYRTSDRLNFDLVVSGHGSTSYVDTPPDPSVPYYYFIRPFNAVPAQMPDSDLSTSVTLDTTPLAPVDLIARTSATTSVDLAWITTPNVVTYELYRGTASGGPYSALTSVAAGTTTYTDSTVTPGTAYFYVVRAKNSSGVESADSNEAGVNLIAAPANLALSNTASGIQVDWDVVGGASSYRVLRSEVSGGPYGLVGSPAGNSYSDSDVVADVTYYYVVEAVFADGSHSLFSSEQSLLRSGSIKLQVPIELFDRSIASSSTGVMTFDRTRTSLNTDFYDGVTSYQFEINAVNFDSSGQDVELVDSSDLTVATITVPASTSSSTRMLVSFTPNTGSDNYRIKLPQTPSNMDVTLYTGRILINQVNASKTRIYYPLLSSRDSATNTDIGGYVEETSSESYVDLQDRLTYLREATKLKEIEPFNGWEIEALVATTGSASGKLMLRNNTGGIDLTQTETRFFDNQIEMARIPLDEGTSGWTTLEEGNRFALRLRCEYDCGSGNARIYKAGLWVTLVNLDKAAVAYRSTGTVFSIGGLYDVTTTRVQLDANAFSNPLFYFQADVEDMGSSSVNVSLIQNGSDSGGAGVSTAPGSNLLFDNDSRYFSRAGSTFTPVSGQRYMTRIDVTGTMVDVLGTAIVVHVSKP